MKILHTADWHLDSPIVGRTPEQTQLLRTGLLSLPDKIAALCKNEGCQLMLLAGDLFDGSYTKESLDQVRNALEEVKIPVFISPGNHDFCAPGSVYLTESFPENVHIFTHPAMEAVSIEDLDCKIYGAGYTAMDCPALLKDFHAEGPERWHIGILHSDPLTSGSPYAPLNANQVKNSGLDYLALGHIHQGGSFRAGEALCAWPGCPMGRGFDESGRKGVLLATLEQDSVGAQFLPLNAPHFYDEKCDAGEDPAEALSALLPPIATQDFYRITLTGYCQKPDLDALAKQFSHIPNLELRDRTAPEPDLWGSMDDDTLEGVYFRMLHDAMETDNEALQQRLKLAARISRQILDGQEVTLQ